MKSKALAMVSVIAVCMTAFAGICIVADESDAASLGSSTNPRTSIGNEIYGYSSAYLTVGGTLSLSGVSDEYDNSEWPTGITSGYGFTFHAGNIPFNNTISGTASKEGTVTVQYRYEYPDEGVADNATVTLHIVRASHTHTIVYDGNGSTGGSTASTVVTDINSGSTSISLSSNGFTRYGYAFAGWKVGNTVLQPGQSVSVGADSTVTAVAQWTQNELTATAGNVSALSGMSYSNQIGASANNGGSLSYAVKSCTGGTATVNSSGNVTYSAPSVSSTAQYTVTVTVTASYPDGSSLSRDVSFTVTVDPVLSFTNAATSGTLSVKGA